MNVKAGDLARIVNSETINDGAIVTVIRYDWRASADLDSPCWFVRGTNLLAFAGSPIPIGVVEEALAYDYCLQRIDDPAARDERTAIDDIVITDPAELECPTT